jgi:hypothetical protein
MNKIATTNVLCGTRLSPFREPHLQAPKPTARPAFGSWHQYFFHLHNHYHDHLIRRNGVFSCKLQLPPINHPFNGLHLAYPVIVSPVDGL